MFSIHNMKACTGVRGEPSAVENCGHFGLPTARMFIFQPSSARRRLSMVKHLSYLTSVKCLRCISLDKYKINVVEICECYVEF